MSQLNEILEPIRNSIDNFSKTLNDIKVLYEAKFLNQQRQINNLLTRVQGLEERLSYQQHISDVNERKIDDLEQVSRKVNLRLKGLK